MKAIRVESPGGIEALRYEDVPVPEPREGEALVRIEAAGVNFIDCYYRTGAYKGAYPMTLGGEGAGIVEKVGPGVTEVKPGDRVGSFQFAGSYAELATAKADRLVVLPDGISTRQAAAALLQGMTAHYLSRSTYRLGLADTCLVHAAAGGVGLLLSQIGRRAGARVIGTAGGPEKVELAKQGGAGAHEVIDYKTSNFVEEVRRLTDGKGVQVVYDSVGKDTFAGSLDCLALRGTLALFGQSSGKVDPIDPQVLNQKGSLFLTRPTLFHYAARREELLERAGDIFRWIVRDELAVRIFREVPLAQAAEAHSMLEGRKTSGKLLLIP